MGADEFRSAMLAEMASMEMAMKARLARRMFAPVVDIYRGAGRRWGKSQRARARRFSSWVTRRARARLPLQLNKAVFRGGPHG